MKSSSLTPWGGVGGGREGGVKHEVSAQLAEQAEAAWQAPTADTHARTHALHCTAPDGTASTYRHWAVHGGNLLVSHVVLPHLRQPVTHAFQPVAAEVVQADVGPVVLELSGGGVGGTRLTRVQLCKRQQANQARSVGRQQGVLLWQQRRTEWQHRDSTLSAPADTTSAAAASHVCSAACQAPAGTPCRTDLPCRRPPEYSTTSRAPPRRANTPTFSSGYALATTRAPTRRVAARVSAAAQVPAHWNCCSEGVPAGLAAGQGRAGCGRLVAGE